MSAFLDALQARLEAVGAGVEISGSELGALTDATARLLAFAREVDRVAEYLRTTEDKTVQTHTWLALAAAFERLEEES